MKNSPAPVVIATVFANLINKASLEFSEEEQLVIEALRRSNNKLAEMSMSDMGDYLKCMNDKSLRGLANNVKGIYHELSYVHYENNNGDSITARVFQETNHPGADVILSKNGLDFAEIQLKATDNVYLIREHFSKYPEITVAATTEVADSMPGVLSSGFSNSNLENEVGETFTDVSDQSFSSQAESAFAVSALMSAALNASKVLSGKETSENAIRHTLRDVGVAVSSTLLVDLLFS